MKIRFAPLAFAAFVLVAAACSSSSGSAVPAPSAPPGGAVIVAQGLKFDRSTLTIPAGTAAPLLFESRDGVPHNVSISAADGSKVFTGETFSGPASKTYQLPALTPASYQFQCDVHPDMKGTLTAT